MQPLDNSLGIPAFLSKLWKMVEDPETDNLICWSKDGKSFIIRNEAEFWYTLLPLYYKHNNMSSFVRQLNMYGFHKVPNVDNSTIDSDKAEYQFLHPCFQRGQHQLLKIIKRKVTTTTSKGDKVINNIEGTQQLGKVILDVKYLRGRQVQVDSVLNNLRQENSVLWRELAVLRQKHQKQQQIVNKLIQFLVTIVQPTTRMGGLGVKRRYPLMINESPIKKQKSDMEGPTIHELDSAEMPPEQLFEGDSKLQNAQADALGINANMEMSSTSMSQQNLSKSPAPLLSEVENNPLMEPEIVLNIQNLDSNPTTSNAVVDVEELLSDPELLEDAADIENLSTIEDEFQEDALNSPEVNYDKVFLNPTSQDALLTNLISGSYNSNVLNSSKTTTNKKNESVSDSEPTNNLAVATRDPNLALARINSVEDIDNHVGSTQNELDQLKEFLNGCNGIDSSYLLNLFNDIPSYGLTPNNQTKEELLENDVLSGSELTPYDSSIVDFNELFDDSADDNDFEKLKMTPQPNADSTDTINTPDVSNLKPTFPLDKSINNEI